MRQSERSGCSGGGLRSACSQCWMMTRATPMKRQMQSWKAVQGPLPASQPQARSNGMPERRRRMRTGSCSLSSACDSTMQNSCSGDAVCAAVCSQPSTGPGATCRHRAAACARCSRRTRARARARGLHCLGWLGVLPGRAQLAAGVAGDPDRHGCHIHPHTQVSGQQGWENKGRLQQEQVSAAWAPAQAPACLAAHAWPTTSMLASISILLQVHAMRRGV